MIFARESQQSSACAFPTLNLKARPRPNLETVRWMGLLAVVCQSSWQNTSKRIPELHRPLSERVCWQPKRERQPARPRIFSVSEKMLWAAVACQVNCGTVSARIARSANCIWSRVIRREDQQKVVECGTFRRSCRCEVKLSTRTRVAKRRFWRIRKFNR